MTNFERPLNIYMSTPVYSVRSDQSLEHAQALMAEKNISSLAVLEGASTLAGVLTRTDLLRVVQPTDTERGRGSLLALPDQPISSIMSTDVESIDVEATLLDAASLMQTKRYHRVFVRAGNEIVGVISTRDLMLAIADAKVATPISEFMSSPVISLPSRVPIEIATDQLAKAQIRGLVVVDGDWPVGIFSQVEALASGGASRDTPVDEVMNPAIFTLPEDTPLHRAAAQAASTRVRRIIAVRGQELRGILTGLDFAAAIA